MVSKNRGFTLLEILVVVALISIVTAFSMSISIPQLQSDKTESTLVDMESTIFLYQQNASSGKDGKSWGIKFTPNSYILFTGISYAGSDWSEAVSLPANVSISQINLSGGGDELVFLSGEFKPNVTGNIILYDGTNSFVIEINSEGLLHYYES